MKRLALLLLLAATTANAEVTRYLVRPTYTSIRFSIVKWSVMKEEGIFREFTGTLDFDPAHPDRSRIEITVQAPSIDTKNDTRDKVLRSEDFLDVARYPTLSFVSRSVNQEGGRWFVTGDLTIHGTTHRIRVPVSQLGRRDLPKIGKLAAFETAFTINRRDYRVLGARWGAVPGTLEDSVDVHIIVGGIRQAR
ncbi:MAG TPA: YceI family protein [Thermoanaerobaculia bacterium]|jgi:polyisoprenoid-binding protein YceI